ncbi:hypothetical protein B0I12_000445 [Microbacterium hydrothermale]|nr:hypothetical protein [Microbacterium hydrothermale]
MSDQVSYDGDVVQHNVINLNAVPDELPTAANLAIVEGNSTEPAATAFTDLVRGRANDLGTQVEAVREYVRLQAEALTKAVAALQETDAISSAVAAQAMAVVDSATGPSGSAATSSGSSGVRSVLPGIPQ